MTDRSGAVTLTVVLYVAVVALGMVGILLTSAEGSGSPLVTVWLGFCGVSGLGLLSQKRTGDKVAEIANGTMESKIRRVIGVELAKYFTNPKQYMADVHEGERQFDRLDALAQGAPKATPRAATHRPLRVGNGRTS